MLDQSLASPKSPWVKSPVSGGGKPKSFAMALNESIRKPAGRSNNDKSSTAAMAAKVASTNAPSAVAKSTTRGRPKRKALVAMYQSQLSENTMGIKIRLTNLKKSIEMPISAAFGNNNNGGYANVTGAPAVVTPTAAAVATSAVTTTTASTTNRGHKKSAPTTTTPVGSPTAATCSTSNTSKPRKRQRKSRHKDTSDSDDSDYEKRRKNNNTTMEKYRNRKQTTNTAGDCADWHEPSEQSEWGNVIPEHILLKIFEEVINQYGSLPTIVNVGRVCSLWRRVSLTPHLWHTLDLSSWTKDRSEINLKRIIATHLRWCKDVNLGKFVKNLDFT